MYYRSTLERLVLNFGYPYYSITVPLSPFPIFSLRSALQPATAAALPRSLLVSSLPQTIQGSGQTAASRRRRGSAGLRGNRGRGLPLPAGARGVHAMVIPPAFSSLVVRSAVGALLAALIAARAVRRRSLDASGGIAGFVVMAVHIACGYRYGALLLAFFLSSSKVTKIGEDRKRRVEEDFKEGGQRNW